MIFEPNAATNPRAVMVHFENTVVTKATMMSPWRLNKFAFPTVSILQIWFVVIYPANGVSFFVREAVVVLYHFPDNSSSS